MERPSSPRLAVSILGSILIIAALVIPPVQADPGLLYVAPGGNCGGASPCYGDIQAAVDAAVVGDEIRIAQGTYSQVSAGGGITAVARIVDIKITVRGGYSISDWDTPDPETNPTVIDPQGDGIGVYINYQADIGIGEIIVDGLSITGGNATEAGAGTDSGGGIFVDHTTHVRVTIQNCQIYGNAAEDGNGGGVWTTRSDNLTITGNEISDNQGSGVVVTYGDNMIVVENVVNGNAGDGIKVLNDLGGRTDVRDNEVAGNDGSGIALNSVVGGSLTYNEVSDNHTTGGGGGIDISGVMNNFLIAHNTVEENSALQGGGIDISGSVAEIKYNRIASNSTTPGSNGGGGLYANAGTEGAYLLIAGNQILSNTTTNIGGGLVIVGQVDVLGNTIAGNSALSGGGMIATAAGTIGGNLISGNSAQIGGGIRTVNAVGLVLERNRVIGNRATNGEGGGINLWGGFWMDVALDGNQVISNTASTKGGGIYAECPPDDEPVELANTVLAGNVAATGSGLYMTVCDADLAYSTIAGNRGTWGDGVGIYLRSPIDGSSTFTVENSILVSQTVGVYVASGTASLEATLWGLGDWANVADTGGPGTIYTGTLNYEGDPLFVNPAGDDYHITAGSPAIDHGVDTWSAIDMDRQPRLAGETDIGADEYWQLLLVYMPLAVR